MPTNPNLQAVYTPGEIVTSAELAEIATQAGQAVRFLAFGVIAIPEKFRGTKSPCSTGLLCGWPEPGTDATREFDAACVVNDRDRLEHLLEEGHVRWFELYVNQFDYSRHVEHKPGDQAKIDGSVQPEHLLVPQSETGVPRSQELAYSS
jgi:hypothetical protein